MNSKNVVMICTAARGGMRSVVEGYVDDGLFSRWNVILLSSHIEGGLVLRLTTAIKAFLTLLGLLLARRVALVHCHAAMKGSFWRKSVLAMIARAAGVPVLFHLHGSEMKSFVTAQPKMLQTLIGWILEKQSVVIVLSESWLHYVKSISPQATVQILPNYVVLPELQSKVASASEDIIDVLFLGLIGKRKGVYDLLPAFKEVVVQVPSLRLTIGGNGELEQAKEMAEKLNIDKNVVFAGWVSGADKVKLLSQSEIYVLPSYNEGLPVSLLEAMSWQVPVISTRVGGIPEQVRDGVDGILIDAGDQKALTAAFLTLAKNAVLRHQMGVSAREQVALNFSKQVVLPKLEGLYEKYRSES